MNWKDTVEWLFFSTVIFALLYLLFTKKFLQFFGLLFLLMLTYDQIPATQQ